MYMSMFKSLVSQSQGLLRKGLTKTYFCLFSPLGTYPDLGQGNHPDPGLRS